MESPNISTHDGGHDYDLDSINSQLDAGATLGAALIGEKTTMNEFRSIIKECIQEVVLEEYTRKKTKL